MKNRIVQTLIIFAFVASVMGGKNTITAHAAEANTATEATQTKAVTLTNEVKAMLKNVFDATYYAETYPDVVAVLGTDADALFNHYVSNGINEGRDASATFNASVYALANPDLVEVYSGDMNSIIAHYVVCGQAEGRVATLATYVAGIKAGTVAAPTSGGSASGAVANTTTESTDYLHADLAAELGLPAWALYDGPGVMLPTGKIVEVGEFFVMDWVGTGIYGRYVGAEGHLHLEESHDSTYSEFGSSDSGSGSSDGGSYTESLGEWDSGSSDSGLSDSSSYELPSDIVWG